MGREALLWEEFHRANGIRHVEENAHIFKTGVLRSLLVRNGASELKYSATFQVARSAEESPYSVRLTPPNGTYYISETLDHSQTGPHNWEKRTLTYPSIGPNLRSPLCLWRYEKLPALWGYPLPGGGSYPHKISVGDGRYIHILSYEDPGEITDGHRYEAIIDAEYSMAILYARHTDRGPDSIWKMRSLTQHVRTPGNYYAGEPEDVCSTSTTNYLWTSTAAN